MARDSGSLTSGETRRWSWEKAKRRENGEAKLAEKRAEIQDGRWTDGIERNRIVWTEGQEVWQQGMYIARRQQHANT